MIRWLLLPLALAACAGREKVHPVEIRTQTVQVPVRAPCPEPAEQARLKALRPKPLRDGEKPASLLERAAAVTAQVLRYEGQGGYADQVEAALDRCQQP